MVVNKFDMLKSLIVDILQEHGNQNLTLKDLFYLLDTVDTKIENQKISQKEHYKNAIRKAARIKDEDKKVYKE